MGQLWKQLLEFQSQNSENIQGYNGSQPSKSPGELKTK